MNRSLRTLGNVFSEIQDSGTVSNKIIYGLIDEFVENPNNFLRGMEQCYLKICKMGTRANKKPIEKFEKITEKFFQLFSQEAHRSKGKKSKIEQDDIYGVLQHLINFLTQGLEAPNIIVRQVCAKHISIMLKVFSNEDFEAILDANVINNLNEGNVSLLRSKQPSLKLLGLKIASYIQKFESDEVQQEVVNVATNEESRDIRKVAIINLRVNESTLPALLTRTRDVDSELRILVYKKLMKHKVHLVKLKLPDIYKVVYDGLFAREEGVRDQCTAYLREVFNLFEGPEESSSAKKSSEKASEAKEIYSKVKLSILRFLKIFQIKKVLTHPHIYDLMEAVVVQLVKAVIPFEKLENYLREFIRVDFKQQKLLNAHPEEIFFIRAISQYAPKHADELTDLNNLLQELFPTVHELSKIIDKSYGKKDLLSTYQILLLAEPLLNSDETGRQALVASLRKILLDINSKIPLNDDEELRDEYNDVFPKKSEQSILLESYAQSFLDTPVIQSADDLTPVVVRILRKLLDDNFSTLLLETISVIREPIEKGDHDNSELNEEKKRLMKHIDHYDNVLKDVDEKIQNAKKAKKNKAAIEELEQEKTQNKAERESYVSKLDDIDTKKSKIDIRCLHIACSLLEGCKLSLTDPGIMGLLGSFIGPCFQEKNAFVKDLSFKCLSLYLLLDKRTCSDYMKIYKNIIDENSDGTESVPSLLTAIKACFDFFLIFKFGVEEEVNFENDDEGEFEAQDIIESLISLMFRGDLAAKKICVEGFCKLLFNNKVKNPVNLLSLLMLIWINPQQTLNEGTKIVQTLSMFYKAYTPYSYSCLKNSEQAIEIFIELLNSVSESREIDFNSDLFSLEMTEDYFTMILRTALSLMKKDDYKFHAGEEDEERISPLERFFVFLALLASDKDKAGKPYKKVFAKNLSQFDFELSSVFNRRLIARFLVDLAEEKDGAPFKEFLKKLQGSEEEEKDAQIDEDDLIQTDRQLVEDIKRCRHEAKQLTKNLFTYQVLVKVEKKKLPRQEASEATNEDKSKPGKQRGRPRKEKAVNGKKDEDKIEEEKDSVEESENEDEEEEDPKSKTKKKKADEEAKKQQKKNIRSRRGPAKKYTEEESENEKESEEESEEEKSEEEPKKKNVRQPKNQKKGAAKEESDDEDEDKEESSEEDEKKKESGDEDDEEDEEESEEAENPTRRSPRGKPTKSRETSSSKKGAKTATTQAKGKKKAEPAKNNKRKAPAKSESDESGSDEEVKKADKRARKTGKAGTKKKK